MIRLLDSERIIVDKKFQILCARPYRNHPRGCPNYAKKECCPPGLPLMNEIFDFKSSLYVIYTSFRVGEFAERMKVEHPRWSKHPRQWYNPRRWQGTARKEHRIEIEKFNYLYPEFEVNRNPEGHGVNVSSLMNSVGVGLSWTWPPEHNLDNLTYIVSLAGKRLAE